METDNLYRHKNKLPT